MTIAKYYNKTKYGTEQLIVDSENKRYSYNNRLQKPYGQYAGYDKMCNIIEQSRQLRYERIELIILNKEMKKWKSQY